MPPSYLGRPTTSKGPMSHVWKSSKDFYGPFCMQSYTTASGSHYHWCLAQIHGGNYNKTLSYLILRGGPTFSTGVVAPSQIPKSSWNGTGPWPTPHIGKILAPYKKGRTKIQNPDPLSTFPLRLFLPTLFLRRLWTLLPSSIHSTDPRTSRWTSMKIFELQINLSPSLSLSVATFSLADIHFNGFYVCRLSLPLPLFSSISFIILGVAQRS